jgi:hypothetical protein
MGRPVVHLEQSAIQDSHSFNDHRKEFKEQEQKEIL